MGALCTVYPHYSRRGVQFWQIHVMITSSNGNIFRVTGHFCAGNSLVTGEPPSQRPVTRSFDIFYDLHLNKWFSNTIGTSETPSCPLLRHCNVFSYRIWQHVWCNYNANDLGLLLLNTLRPRQNGCHFVDYSSKCIFLNENAWIWDLTEVCYWGPN